MPSSLQLGELLGEADRLRHGLAGGWPRDRQAIGSNGKDSGKLNLTGKLAPRPESPLNLYEICVEQLDERRDVEFQFTLARDRQGKVVSQSELALQQPISAAPAFEPSRDSRPDRLTASSTFWTAEPSPFLVRKNQSVNRLPAGISHNGPGNVRLFQTLPNSMLPN